jgi:hypothetical protein
MHFINAIKLHRKFGVAEWKDLQFAGSKTPVFLVAARIYPL